eukprot:100839_1
MSDDRTTLITTHREPNYGIYSESQPLNTDDAITTDDQKNIEEDQCRSTTKILAFATFLIALSIGGYFTADLLANKGESVKLIRLNINTQHYNNIINAYDNIDITQDIRVNYMPQQGQNQQTQTQGQGQGQAAGRLPQQGQQQSQFGDSNTDNGKGKKGMDTGEFSMMKVTNCDKSSDISMDSETYQTDIRAVANYMKTYWNSYQLLINNEIAQLSNGDPLDPTCLQEKFEEGEVLCKDVTCVYDGECIDKTAWDAVTICKYMYFDIGSLRHQERANRRACIASMLVNEWSDSCWKHDHISNEMKMATFKWWKIMFTVSDDWELDNCPCN